jgi:putative heme degradation protein
MQASEHTIKQIERALKKVAQKFNVELENQPLTDIHIQVNQESGELLVFNDEDVEITRCVVEEWIDSKDEDFYEHVKSTLLQVIQQNKDITEGLHVLRPYSYVLVDEDHETICDLYLVDDDTIVLDGELMEGLSEDLDQFWEELRNK